MKSDDVHYDGTRHGLTNIIIFASQHRNTALILQTQPLICHKFKFWGQLILSTIYLFIQLL